MTLDSLIMLCGALVAIVPFLGLPNSWDTVLFTILGACIVGLGIVVRRRTPRRSLHSRDAQFVEHQPAQSTLHDEA